MLSDPEVTITCDTCRFEEGFYLTPTARGSYDERDLQNESERSGWVWQEGEHICDTCAGMQRPEAQREAK